MKLTGEKVSTAALDPRAANLEPTPKRRLFSLRLSLPGHIAIGFLLITGAAALLAPLVAPYSPNEVNYDDILVGPGLEHPLGTDEFGRDQLSRLLYGSRISILVPLGAVALGTILGGLVGLMAGYAGGWFDSLTQRLGDMVMSFPFLVAALVIVTVLGPSMTNVIITLAVVQLPRAARIVRSSTLTIREELYVEAARVIGAPPIRIVLRHVLPGTIAPFIVAATIALGAMVLAEASMSFLGLGVPPPTPTWGNMLSGSSRLHVNEAPWLVISPGVAITLIVLAFNTAGDALRDALDPRLKNS